MNDEYKNRLNDIICDSAWYKVFCCADDDEPEDEIIDLKDGNKRGFIVQNKPWDPETVIK